MNLNVFDLFDHHQSDTLMSEWAGPKFFRPLPTRANKDLPIPLGSGERQTLKGPILKEVRPSQRKIKKTRTLQGCIYLQIFQFLHTAKQIVC